MINIIQVTASYSNAVLVAILPQISDFCRKLDLPVQVPISIQQVEHFHCFDKRDDPGGGLILTNDYSLGFHDGVVSTFRDERRSFRPGSANEINGELHMNQTEAVAFARDIITKLGYSESDLYTDGKPSVHPPFHYGTNFIPYYRVEWFDPEGYPCVSMEIDGNHKELISMEFMTRTMWRTPPKIDLGPEQSNSLKIADQKMHDAAKLPLLLKEISNFASTLALPVATPITSNQVVDLSIDSNGLGIEVRLANGFCFRCYSGHVIHFEAPDAFFVAHLNRHVSAYWNQWNISEREAEDLARQTLRRLGYSETFFCDGKPRVKKLKKIGAHTIPRYMLTWEHDLPAKREESIVIDSLLTIEIDAGTKTVKQMWILNESVLQPSRPEP